MENQTFHDLSMKSHPDILIEHLVVYHIREVKWCIGAFLIQGRSQKVGSRIMTSQIKIALHVLERMHGGGSSMMSDTD